jgi:hypothetical protein
MHTGSMVIKLVHIGFHCSEQNSLGGSGSSIRTGVKNMRIRDCRHRKAVSVSFEFAKAHSPS